MGAGHLIGSGACAAAVRGLGDCITLSAQPPCKCGLADSNPGVIKQPWRAFAASSRRLQPTSNSAAILPGNGARMTHPGLQQRWGWPAFTLCSPALPRSQTGPQLALVCCRWQSPVAASSCWQLGSRRGPDGCNTQNLHMHACMADFNQIGKHRFEQCPHDLACLALYHTAYFQTQKSTLQTDKETSLSLGNGFQVLHITVRASGSLLHQYTWQFHDLMPGKKLN